MADRFSYAPLLLLLAGAGCTRLYYVDEGTLAEARRLESAGTPATKLTVASTAADDLAPVNLRWSSVRNARVRRVTAGTPPVAVTELRADDSRASRATGVTLFALAAAHIAVIGVLIGYDVSRRDQVMGDGWPGASYLGGIPLGVVAGSLLQPAIPLLIDGYGTPVDVRPGRPDRVYLGQPPSLGPPTDTTPAYYDW